MDNSLFSYTLHKYALPLVHTQDKREGILLCINDMFWGEIAPLPGFSRETLQEAYTQLQEVLPLLASHKTSLENLSLFPSVQFGIESALYSMNHETVEFSVPLSALLMGSYEDILRKAEQCEKEGYKSAKLKISQLSKKEAFDLIHLLKDKFSLRIDLNRSWELSEAVEFFSSFKEGAYMYIEEPLKDPFALRHFPFPLALDESLKELTDAEIGLIPDVKAFIFKPTLLGGFTACKKYKELAAAHNANCVLSSAFESGVGIRNIAHLSHALKLSEIPLGIDTYRYLKQDVLETRLDFSKGVLHL